MPDEDGRTSFRQLLRRLRVDARIPEPRPDELSDDELIRLIEGKLSVTQQQLLEKRLAACPLSTDRLAIVREALREAGVVLPRVWYLAD